MAQEQGFIPIQGSIFKFLADLFKKREIACILVGGYALVANKVQRMTFDIDFIIGIEDLKKILSDLALAGYFVAHEQAAFIQLKSNQPGLRDLDFLISDQRTIQLLISQSKTVTIAGEVFTIPNPVHLIEMKLHSIAGNKDREPKDLPDIQQLIIANDLGMTSDLIKKLFEKYHLNELYQKIAGTA